MSVRKIIASVFLISLCFCITTATAERQGDYWHLPVNEKTYEMPFTDFEWILVDGTVFHATINFFTNAEQWLYWNRTQAAITFLPRISLHDAVGLARMTYQESSGMPMTEVVRLPVIETHTMADWSTDDYTNATWQIGLVESWLPLRVTQYTIDAMRGDVIQTISERFDACLRPDGTTWKVIPNGEAAETMRAVLAEAGWRPYAWLYDLDIPAEASLLSLCAIKPLTQATTSLTLTVPEQITTLPDSLYVVLGMARSGKLTLAALPYELDDHTLTLTLPESAMGANVWDERFVVVMR